MKFKIVHETTYTFTSEIFLEPHYFRFKPKTTPHIKLKAFSLNIMPQPAGLSHQYDAEDNHVHFGWFNGLHSKLEVHAESVVEVEHYNPFNFLIHPSSFNTLPIEYPKTLKQVLLAALAHGKLSKELVAYGDYILKSSNNNTLKFITDLTIQIHNDFVLEYRHFGSPLEPDMTFKTKRGSCRDFTWMQIQLLRHLGIAARFVSGYYYIEIEEPNYELHAWLEVFIPGAGWLGFDPSNGIMVEQNHIPVASSVNFMNTMPVTGTIRGNATSELATNLLIEVIN